MPNPSLATYLNSLTPVAAPGYQNALPQTDGALPLTSVSLGVPNTGGSSKKTASYEALAIDCGTLLVFDSSTPVTLTLPALPPFAQWTVSVVNIGGDIVTVSPGSLTLNGSSGMSLQPTNGAIIATDGANYFSVRAAVGTTIYDGAADPTIDLGIDGDLFIELNYSSGSPVPPPPISFQFTQNSPASVWVIAHGLATYPAVTVIDSSGNWVLGAVHFDSLNQVTVTFSAAFSGIAVLV